MFYEIENNIFNLDEVLYVSFNGVEKITIVFNNKSQLDIYFGVDTIAKAREEYQALCNEFYNEDKLKR